MLGGEFIVRLFEEVGVTDAFGIPGGVILDLIYSLSEKSSIELHIGYHEQGAAYAAVGFSQVSNRPSIAYATHGPGIMNMITSIYDAFLDSVPVIFVTAHNHISCNPNVRSEWDQEIDLTTFIGTITKAAIRIDTIDDLTNTLPETLKKLTNDRPGPVYLDFNTVLFNQHVETTFPVFSQLCKYHDFDAPELIEKAAEIINRAKRPIILAGDGINISNSKNAIVSFAKKYNIPILTSKNAQNIISCDEDISFGYIGSHGLRHSNFILSKSDCIIAVGNRLSFPFESKSYKNIVENKVFIRIDIDPTEFTRNLPNSLDLCNDIRQTLTDISKGLNCDRRDEWIKICRELRDILKKEDFCDTCEALVNIIRLFDSKDTIVCDVGNNELRLMRALDYSGVDHRVIHSKSLKTAGCAIPKAIGVYYSTKRPVLCVVGDQGFQFNIQELEVIKKERLPITIVVINNKASAMILQQEKRKGWDKLLQVSMNSGYLPCDLEKIALAYQLTYVKYNGPTTDIKIEFPCICEIAENVDIFCYPILPQGEPCQNLFPFLEEKLYKALNDL